jgi:predicted ribosomally synthesized peptide with SipW-like signal peptide
MTTSPANRAERRSRKRPIVAAVLALVAVGGIGAVATSAAWTDNVFFTAPAQAATFDLQGSLDGSTWVQSDNPNSIQLVVPAATFANLLPGQTRNVTLYVENTGTANSALVASAAWASGSTFTTNPTISVSPSSSTLAAATGSTPATTTVTLTVSAPSDWAAVNQGKAGNVVVTVSGTATS